MSILGFIGVLVVLAIGAFVGFFLAAISRELKVPAANIKAGPVTFVGDWPPFIIGVLLVVMGLLHSPPLSFWVFFGLGMAANDALFDILEIRHGKPVTRISYPKLVLTILGAIFIYWQLSLG